MEGIPTETLVQPVETPVVFGRGGTADVKLTDETVSGEQMKLFVRANQVTGEVEFFMCTVSPTNPVYINGKPVRAVDGDTVLCTNDKVGVGELDFMITVRAGYSMESFKVEFVKNQGHLQEFLGQVLHALMPAPLQPHYYQPIPFSSSLAQPQRAPYFPQLYQETTTSRAQTSTKQPAENSE